MLCQCVIWKEATNIVEITVVSIDQVCKEEAQSRIPQNPVNR